MFGGGSTPSLPRSESSPAGVQAATETKSPSPDESTPAASATTPSKKQSDQSAAGDKAEGNGGSSAGRRGASAADADKKRRSSGVGSKASSLLATAKSSLSSFGQGARAASDASAKTPLQKLGKQDPALAVPQGQHNNSAGESLPGPRSTFRVGVWEDRNKKCRRTMEDTHAFLYNFLATPAPTAATSSSAAASTASKSSQRASSEDDDDSPQEMIETDNGYFAIFDGHAGTFAADWCGKKLHVILEDAVRKHPNTPLPELLDMTFTTVDSELEKLPLKNSGCTAAIAVLRWEDRVPSDQSLTGSQAIAPATAAAAADAAPKDGEAKPGDSAPVETVASKLRSAAQRQRVLYTANVGDARIILCRNGKALRLSYDHKGSDANEGRRIANAGGLILNNRVNGVLAVTRALGDTYIKELVTGHPYTTETVIQPDHDEFIIIACDGVSIPNSFIHSLSDHVSKLTHGGKCSCGTCAQIKKLWSSSGTFKTPSQRPSCWSTTRWAVSRPTTCRA